jgi:fucose permease
MYFAFFTAGLMSIMLGTLLPYVREANGLNYSQSGLMLSAHQLGNLCSGLVVGILPYLIGRKKSVLLLGAGMMAGLVLMTIFRSPWLLFMAFALTGIGRGAMSNVCNAVTSEVSGHKTAALNLLHAIFAIGALLSPLVVFAFTSNINSGWKYAALSAATLAAVTWIMLARSRLSTERTNKESGGSFQFLKDFQLWLSTLILFFYLCAEVSIIGWFVVYFRDTGILPAVAAEFTPTMLWLMMMVGRLLCAALPPRINRGKLLLILAVSMTICFVGLMQSNTAATSVLFLLGIGFSMAGIFPTTFSTIRGTSSAMATGVVLGIAGLGAIVMPGIVGVVADSHGLPGGISTILAALLAMVIMAVIKCVTNKNSNEK